LVRFQSAAQVRKKRGAGGCFQGGKDVIRGGARDWKLGGGGRNIQKSAMSGGIWETRKDEKKPKKQKEEITGEARP